LGDKKLILKGLYYQRRESYNFGAPPNVAWVSFIDLLARHLKCARLPKVRVDGGRLGHICVVPREKFELVTSTSLGVVLTD
jgi:hypothetical protein